MFTRRLLSGLFCVCIFGCAHHQNLSVDQGHSENADSSKTKSNSAVKDPDLALEKAADSDSLEVSTPDTSREAAIQQWSQRVRSTVEPYWVLPRVLVKHKYRAVAKIRILRSGGVQNITWTEKSKSIVFNNLAAKALKKVKRFPPFPPAIQDTALDLQYEFVTPGLKGPRRKLELLRKP